MRFYAATLAAASAIGMAFAVLPAKAQEYGPPYDGYNNYEGTHVGSSNEVVVLGPRFHAESSPLNAPPEKVWMSLQVSYADLDLTTPRGAYELRKRVRIAAADICGRLREIYPYAVNPHEPCFRATLNQSMPHANEAIDDARITARRAHEDRYYGGYDR